MREKAYTSSFARIYDEIMGSVPYNLWFEYLHELLDFYYQKPKRVLDLACGTGNMSIRFARKGYEVTAVDRSGAMLDVAREKAQFENLNINFIESDLRDFEVEKRFDFAFSLFDSINYILDIEDLRKVFNNVFNSLKHGGIFIFDMNTLARLMDIEPGTTVFHGEDYTCIWEDIINQKEKKWQVKLNITFQDTGEEFQEFHEETSFPTLKVTKCLKTAGFDHIDIYNAYTFNEGNDKHDRLYYVAFKSSGKYETKPPIKKAIKIVKWKFNKLFNLAGSK